MAKIIKLVEEKGVCSLPWVNAQINVQQNNISPCCKYEGNFGKLSDGFINVWSNSDSNKLRQDTSEGIQRTECRACDVDESSFSYKKFKNLAYKKNYDFLSTIDSDIPTTPSVFNISLDNTCNLACRMCGPGSSSKLNQLVKKHTGLQQYIGVSVSTKKMDLEVLSGSFKNAEIVTFSGGEPLINNDIVDMIKMIRMESSNLKRINFSTNLTRINDKLFKELSDTGCNITFSISIDGPPHIHNYIRYYCDWNIMMKNLVYIRDNYPRIKFGVNSTISIFNVGYVTDILDTLEGIQNNFGIKFQNLMTSPVIDWKFLHPSLLPRKIKDEYLNKIAFYKEKTSINNSNFFLPTAVELLNGSPTETIDQFIEYAREFDNAAKTNILEVYPEFRYFIK